MEYTCTKCNSNEYYTHRGYKFCKPCRQNYQRNRYQLLTNEKKAKYRARSKQWQEDNIFRYHYLQSKNRAKYNKWDFELTPEILEQKYTDQNGKCYYTGNQMSLKQDNKQYSISVERKDNSVGYTKENTVLCCCKINSIKNSFSELEFLNMVERIYMHRIHPSVKI